MKITDKIVTSVTLPQQTNVLWHNPETGELKMFGNSGWSNAGGNPDATGGGYPVVTVEDDFNIEAQPNTFYNIKNSADDEININCSEGYSVDGKRKHIMFTFDGYDSGEFGEIPALFSHFGGVVLPDTTREGYSYKMEVDSTFFSGGGEVSAYFSDEVKTGNSVTCLLDVPGSGQDLVIIPMNNIQVLTDNVDYLVWVTITEGSTSYTAPHVFVEVENDIQIYQHKYAVFGMSALFMGAGIICTNEPYTTATSFYISNGTDISSMADSIEVKPNMFLPPNDIANEFVFNVNSPANITFNVPVNWNNDSAPDLTQTGVCTISIVNGVGCYTFV